MTGFPPPVRVVDAVIGPLSADSSKRTLACQADVGDAVLEHLRAPSHEKIANAMRVDPVPAGDRAAMPLVEEPAVYAGPMFYHFGHFVAESMHRLWPVKTIPALADAAIVFQITAKKRAVPGWLVALFDLFEIDFGRVILLDRLTRFRELHIPRQGRVLGGKAGFPGYDDFTLVPRHRPPATRDGRLYFGRSQHLHTGGFFGETLVESFLESSSVTICRPETAPMARTVDALRAARLVAFAEGSAIHNLELSGAIDADALVLARRVGADARWPDLLNALTRSHRIVDLTTGGITFQWDRTRNRPSASQVGSLVDLRAMLDDLAAFFEVPKATHDDAALADAVRNDVARLVLDPRATSSQTTDEQLGMLLRAAREAISSQTV